jgi:hypothetical protein
MPNLNTSLQGLPGATSAALLLRASLLQGKSLWHAQSPDTDHFWQRYGVMQRTGCLRAGRVVNRKLVGVAGFNIKLTEAEHNLMTTRYQSS